VLDPRIAKTIVFVAAVATIVIRAPHGRRSRTVPIAHNAKGALETTLLMLVMAGYVLPVLWIAWPVFPFADYPLRAVPLLAGTVSFVAGLVLFHRAHADLGTNWSATLQVRENHTLVTEGVYRRIRHPMYAALWLYAIGQALVVPNWIVGPAYLVTFGLLYALRVNAEERLMRERFGNAYEAYRARTKRLVPGIW